MESIDASDYEVVAFTLEHGEYSRSHTVYIESGSIRRDVMQTLSQCINSVLGEIWREWNEFH